MPPAREGRSRADVGVFGGSGLYSLLDDATEIEIDTGWGRPSGPLTIGEVGGVRVAFLARHGVGHRIPPHRIPYRANVAAMRAVGVRHLVSPFAAGSLRANLHPGDFVVVDQLVDRTSGRADTFHDDFADGPQHVSLAEPYDAGLRQILLDAARNEELDVHDGGTVVVVNGPRFSTRAESQWFAKMGADLVNMTQHPEAALSREVGLRFAAIALVTDYDAGLDGHPEIRAVSQEQVFELFDANVDRMRSLLYRAIRCLAPLAGGPTSIRTNRPA